MRRRYGVDSILRARDTLTLPPVQLESLMTEDAYQKHCEES